jgi:hypothetical protein
MIQQLVDSLHRRFGSRPVEQAPVVPLAFVVHLITAAGLDLRELLAKMSASYNAHANAAEQYRSAQSQLEANAREAKRLAQIAASQASARETTALGVSEAHQTLQQFVASDVFHTDTEEVDVMGAYQQFLQQQA